MAGNVLVYFVRDTHQTMNELVLGNWSSINRSYYSAPLDPDARSSPRKSQRLYDLWPFIAPKMLKSAKVNKPLNSSQPLPTQAFSAT